MNAVIERKVQNTPDLTEYFLKEVVKNSSQEDLFDLNIWFASYISKNLFEEINDVASNFGAQLTATKTEKVELQDKRVIDFKQTKFDLERIYKSEPNTEMTVSNFINSCPIEVKHQVEEFLESYPDYTQIEVLNLLNNKDIFSVVFDERNCDTDHRREALRLCWLMLQRTKHEKTHTAKSYSSIEAKKNRKPVKQMTDLVRGTTEINKPISENDLLTLISQTSTKISDNPIVHNGKTYPWGISRQHIKPKYSEGYSDVTLVYHVNIDGYKLFYEMQFNTREYIEAKKIETQLYDQRKKITNQLNNLIGGILEILQCDYQPLKPRDLNSVIENLLKNKALNIDQINRKCQISNFNYFKSVISPLIHSSIGLGVKSLDKYSRNQLRDICNGVGANGVEIYKRISDLIIRFTELFEESKKCYSDLSGVISSPEDAEHVEQEILKFPIIKKMLVSNEEAGSYIRK